jgi:hypothetical protein
MQLVHLTKENCPTCGARTVSCEQKMRHCNGEWFENRAYECGYKLEYVPNFSRSEDIEMCKKSEAYKTKNERRRKAVDALAAFVGALDVDDAFKNRVMREYSYFNSIY